MKIAILMGSPNKKGLNFCHQTWWFLRPLCELFHGGRTVCSNFIYRSIFSYDTDRTFILNISLVSSTK